MKVHTESIQFKADVKLLDFIEKKLSKLDLFFDRIIDADVKLKLENSGQVRDKIAEIRLHVPGQSLFVKETDKTFEISVDNAVEDLRRQLIRYKEKMREHNNGV
jgi:putative sigma-54 modulation protein